VQERSVDSQVSARLAALLTRNGCIRRQNPDRVANEDRTSYKKGDEIRLTASSQAELEEIRSLLVTAGFKPGAPYAHRKHIRQPLYGRGQVARFLEVTGLG